ncbi:MAG TPA: lyase family protein, partial [Phycisphaerales bacterium]|nr:lyase family protein [Phycisphaerales bacterium]
RSLLAQLAGDPLGLGLCPLGAGAVAGSCLPLDRRHTAGALGFVRPAPSSIDATASRDEALDFVYALARTAMHLSRWAEQWVIYCTSEFALLALDERFTTGSSMMPQKRNPDMLELIRGRCGGVYGDLVALLTICKGLPVGYSRDLQEDKRHVFSAFDTVSDCLAMAARVIATARFVPERLAESLHRHGGFLDATSLAEYLVTRGVPFRTAHQVVGGLVRECERRGVTSLSQLEPEQITEAVRGAGIRDVQVGPEVAGWLGPAAVVARYQTEGNAGLSGYRAYFGFGPRAARSAGPLLEPDPPAGPRGDGVAGVTSPVTAPRAGPPDVPGAEDPSAGPGAPESDHDPVLFAAGGPIAVAPGGPDAGLIEAYASIGRTLDDLPYTDEFERLYERAGAEARGLSRHRLLHRLHNLRKAGRLPRVGKASASPIRLPEAEERTLRELVAEVAGSLGQRDQLPYTPGFDVVAEQFEARSGRALSRHDLWRLIAKLAK